MKRIYTPIKKKTILLVDDDQLIVQAYREKLQNHGFQVEVASNSESALQKLRSHAVEMVLLDLCLPGMNGIEVLKTIRAEFPLENLPIIAFANPYLTTLARTAIENGANKCLTKSDRAQLFELVRAALAPTRIFADNAFTYLTGTLLLQAPEILARLRAGHQLFARTEEEESRRAELRGMQRQVRSLAVAGLAGLSKISQMSNAFEALLIELQAKPKKVTPSVIRTVAQAVDSLAALLDQATRLPLEAPPSPKILVVDDETISRETICAALEKATLVAVSLDDSLAAQRALEQEPFDLIFLDVEMPGLTGFDLCMKIREMETNRATPVVFVTAHSDFASRAQSAMSGGNDFITKPFLSGELAVKALACLFKESPRAISMATVPTNVPLSMVRHESQPSLDHIALSVREKSILEPDAVV